MYREIEVKDFLPVLLEQLKFSEYTGYRQRYRYAAGAV